MVLLLVDVIVFGGRLPEAAKRVGRMIGKFKGAMREDIRRLDRDLTETPPANWEPPPAGDECRGFDDPEKEEQEENK